MSRGDSTEGRCLSCGFLAKHAKDTGRPIPAPTFYEIETDARLDGKCFTHVPDTLLGPVETEPECIKFAAMLRKEVLDETDHAGSREAAAVEVFWRDRQCKSWYPYIPGLGPIEHIRRYETERLSMIDRALNYDFLSLSKRHKKTAG